MKIKNSKLIKKNGLYYPTKEFQKKALVNKKAIYKKAEKDPLKFWENLAEELKWQKKWDKVFEHQPPYFKWFLGGKINITENALDRNLEKRADKIALIWEPEPTNEKEKVFTYQELLKEVNKFANALKRLGVKKGDRVGIYLPMIPEVLISMLACARIGAVHSVVFSAFSPQALKVRLEDTEAKILITADGYYRRGKIIDLKKSADEGVIGTKVEKIIVVKRANNEVQIKKERDYWYSDLIKNESEQCQPEPMDSEDLLFILYTSGCCHKDTLIQLDTGEIKKISDLVEKGGSNLININLNELRQNSEPIINKYRYHWPFHLWKIQTPLSEVMVTPNHPLFVLTKEGNIIEKEAKDINTGEHILQVIKIKVKGYKQRLPRLEIRYNEKKCNRHNLNNKPVLSKYLNPEFAQILGYLIGDGNITDSAIVATDKDKENLFFYKNLFETEFKVRSAIKNSDRQRLIINSAYLARYLKEVFPEIFFPSYEKKIPRRIQVSENKCIAAFIRGFFDAEGSVTGGRVKVTSQSKELIQTIQMLLLRFGILTNYCEENREVHFGNKYHYKILVPGLTITDRESLNIFRKNIGFSSKDKDHKLNNLLKKLESKKIASMIHQVPINSLARMIRDTIKLPKRECHKIFLDSYIYSDRRIKKDRIPQIKQYIRGKINLIRSLNSSGRKKLTLETKQEIKTAISLFKISRKEIAKVSGKSYETVHQYFDRKEPLVSEKTINKFYKSFIPYLSELKKKKLKTLNEILNKIEKLEKLRDVEFFEVKKITKEKNNSNLVYDLGAFRNHNYIANGVVVHNSTGKPKGTVHICGGYTVQAYWTGKWIFDLKEDDIFWCTADIGWITGATYGCYSPLLNGITSIIFEGSPDWPEPDRWCDIIEKYKVTTFYTAPTAIRMFEKYGTDLVRKHKLESLQILGSVGEPIDEAAWQWYFKEVGQKRCPLVDTWWQTETGGILISSLPGLGPFKPCFAGLAFPGVKFDIWDEKGRSCPFNKEGNLVILPPFAPGLLRDIYKNPEKYLETYWKQYDKKAYFTSDGALRDKNGLFRLVGRVDDVIKVAGHRITTGELESAVALHPDITESAVIGIADEIKGEVPLVFVISKTERPLEKIKEEVIALIRKQIGPIASPKEVYLVKDLPKTRSGKIMRRILRKLFTGEDLGDLSTLANPESVEEIKKIINL